MQREGTAVDFDMTREEIVAFLKEQQFQVLPNEIRALSFRDPNRRGSSRETIRPGLVIGNRIVLGIFKLADRYYIAIVENNRRQPEW